MPDDIIWRYVNLFDIFISLSSDERRRRLRCERVRNELVIVVKWKCEVSSSGEVKENSLVTIGDASGELSWESRFFFRLTMCYGGPLSTLMTWSRRIYKHVGLRREREFLDLQAHRYHFIVYDVNGCRDLSTASQASIIINSQANILIWTWETCICCGDHATCDDRKFLLMHTALFEDLRDSRERRRVDSLSKLKRSNLDNW